MYVYGSLIHTSTKGVNMWEFVDRLHVCYNKSEGSRLDYFSPLHPDILDESGGAVNEMFAEYFSTNTDGQGGESNSNG